LDHVFVPFCFFGAVTVWVYLGHQRKVLEMKLRSGAGGDSNVVRELQEMKQQMADLRDTTTRYDMSFDAALQRMESRMNMVEQRLTTVEHAEQSANVERS
jgi:hypothetical protein